MSQIKKEIMLEVFKTYYLNAIPFVERFGLPIYFHLASVVSGIIINSVRAEYIITTDGWGVRRILLRPPTLYAFAQRSSDVTDLLRSLNIPFQEDGIGVYYNPQ